MVPLSVDYSRHIKANRYEVIMASLHGQQSGPMKGLGISW